jgi:hypothetical protein
VSCHCARYAIEVGRPTTAGLKFVRRLVERGVACGAGVDTLFGHVLVIFAGGWRFSALFSQDSELFCWMC